MSRSKGCDEERVARVLVVESEVERLRRLLDRLTADGIETIGATSVTHALTVVERGEAGIVVLGVPRLERDALAILRQMRTDDGERCAVIVYGGCASVEMVKAAIDSGVYAYVERRDGARDAEEELIRHIHRARETVLARYAHSLETLVVQRTTTLRDQLDRLAKLHEVAVRLHASTERKEVYDMVLDAIVTIVGMDRCAILLFDAEGVMRFQAWRGLSASYRQGVEGHGPWHPKAVRPAPLLVSDVSTEPTLAAYRELFQQEGIGGLAFIPLVRPDGQGLVGKLMLYAPAPVAWSDDLVQLAQVIADHLVAALLRVQAEEALRQAYRQRQQFCLDLHDGILQSLYAVGLRLQVAKQDAAVAPFLAESLGSIIDQLNVVIKDVRGFIETVVNGAATKENTELVKAVEELLTAIESEYSVRIERRLGLVSSLLVPSDQAVHVLSIVKEALSNSFRHSHATRRWIALRRRRSGVRLEIGDNGIGFDQCQMKRRGMGLSSMVSRAERIGGRFTIRTRLGRGTRIVLELPWAGAAEPPLSHEQPVMSVTELRGGGSDCREHT